MPAPRKKATTKRRAVKPARAHLLIIECDSQKLAAQGLHLGTGFGQLATKLFPKKRIASEVSWPPVALARRQGIEWGP
jgi:hypothetical protein